MALFEHDFHGNWGIALPVWRSSFDQDLKNCESHPASLLTVTGSDMTQPLRKRDSNGRVYERPAEIEATLETVVNQELSKLKCRGEVSDRTSPEFLPSECLVYLIREARRLGNDETMNVLLPILLRRCAANLKRKVPESGLPNAYEIREEILSRFSVLFAEDGEANHLDELDYYECRFNRAFRTLRIDILNRERKRAEKLERIESDKSMAGEDSADDEELRRDSEELRSQPSQIPRVHLKELLEFLPENERRAAVLCYLMGYKEESNDPLERTAATICKVSGRTIRKRLRRASTMLSQLKSKKGV